MRRYPRLAGVVLVIAAGGLFAGRGWSGQAGSGGPPPKTLAPSQSPAPPAAALYEAERVHFSAPPPVATLATTQCDAEGNVYIQYLSSLQSLVQNPQRGLGNAPLTRVSVKSKKTTIFQMPAPEGYTAAFDHRFFIMPRGDVYELMIAYRHPRDFDGPNWPDTFVVRFKDDGTVDSLTKLEPPPEVHFTAMRLGVFGDGTFLVTGLEVAGRRQLPANHLTAWFDRAGAYKGPITLADDIQSTGFPPKAAGAAPPSPGEGGNTGVSQSPEGPAGPWFQQVQASFMLPSPDGSLYLIRATSPALVYVVSPGGVVARGSA